jgi:hypothetical protein
MHLNSKFGSHEAVGGLGRRLTHPRRLLWPPPTNRFFSNRTEERIFAIILRKNLGTQVPRSFLDIKIADRKNVDIQK